jgi:hypothetical protein
MNHQKVMNDFRMYMGKRNKSIYGWIVIWLTGIVLFLLTSEKYGKTAGEHVGMVYVLGAGLLLLMATAEYVKKYTHFYGMGSASNEVGFLGSPSQENLADIARSLSFDAGSYFFLLGKRLLPMQVVSEVIVLAIGLIGKIQILQLIIFMIMIVLLPWAWLLVKRIQLQRMMTRGSNAGERFLLGFLRAIATFARIILVGLSFVYFAFLVIGLCGTSKLLAGIDEQEVVRFSMNGGIWIIATVVSCIGISLFFTDTDKELVIALWGKVRTGIIAALLVVMVVSIAMYCRAVTKGDLVKLTENAIMVRQHGIEKTYGLGDIADYRIFCQNSAVQMELSFRDGNKETLFKGISEDTEGWYQAYYSDYNYVAHLVDSLKELGVTGTLEDQGKLEQIVSTYDQECIDGFEHFSEALAR